MTDWQWTPSGLIVPRAEQDRAWASISGNEVTRQSVTNALNDNKPLTGSWTPLRIGHCLATNDIGGIRSAIADGIELQVAWLKDISADTTGQTLQYYTDTFGNDSAPRLCAQRVAKKAISIKSMAALEWAMDHWTSIAEHSLTDLLSQSVGWPDGLNVLLQAGAKPRQPTINACLSGGHADAFRRLFSLGDFTVNLEYATQRTRVNADLIECMMELAGDTKSIQSQAADWFFRRNPIKYFNRAATNGPWFRTLKAIVNVIDIDTLYGVDPKMHGRTKREAIIAARQTLKRIEAQQPTDWMGNNKT